jgi:hypothetical protein
MKRMKNRFTYALLLSLISFTLFAQNAVYHLDDIYIDEIPVSANIASETDNLSSDAVCYRVFVKLIPGVGVNVITGTPEQSLKGLPAYPLRISTSTEFFNSQFGSTKGEGINSGLLIVDSSLIYDSFVTMGGVLSNRIGVPTFLNEEGFIAGTPSETILSPGLDLSMLGTENSSDAFVINSGSWGSLTVGGEKGPVSVDSNYVLIGQFTTDGNLSIDINVQLTINNSNFEQFTSSGSYYNFVQSGGNYYYMRYSGLSNVYGPDITHPEVAFAFADTSAEAGGAITLVAEASDSDGSIDSVEFRINGLTVGVDYTAPYEYVYEPNLSTVGIKRANAVAIDNDGAVTQSEPIRITIVSPEPENPSVLITNIKNEDRFVKDESISIEVLARDNDGDIRDTVELFVDDVKYATATIVNDTATFNWTPTTKGEYVLRAKATDTTNLSASQSVTIEVINGILPAIEITKPGLNDTTCTEYDQDTIMVNSTDSDGTIQQVEFFLNGVSIGVDTQAPYQVFWDPETVGNVSVIAVATDDEMNTNADTVVVYVKTCFVGKQEISIKDLSVYPNPVQDELFIDVSVLNDSEAFYRIIDAQGRTLESERIESKTTETINTSELEKGMHLLIIQSNSGIYRSVFIKE